MFGNFLLVYIPFKGSSQPVLLPSYVDPYVIVTEGSHILKGWEPMVQKIPSYFYNTIDFRVKCSQYINGTFKK